MVDKGVPSECTAAAAWWPIDSSSCSFAKISSNLLRALPLFLASYPKRKPK